MSTTSFRSPLAQDLDAYFAVNRALGRKFVNEEKVLRHLDRLVSRRFPEAQDLSLQILEAWMAENPQLLPQSRAVRLRVVRQFCIYRRRTYPDAFVPERLRYPSLWPVRVPRHIPFIFTKGQIRDLLRAAKLLPGCAKNPGRPRTFFTFFLLLYATGLRLSEAGLLKVGDVDFTMGTLLVRETKFFKTRLVPVAADVLDQLRIHTEALHLPSGQAGLDQPLFQHGGGRAYSITAIRDVGCQLLRSCGLKPARGRGGARLHDFRHTFAVHRIAQWYEQGADVQSLLPVLATYMGHKDIVSTQYYITITAEILGHASRRFEQACAPEEE